MLEEIAKRGSFEKRDLLLRQYPATLLELMRIQGLGSKGVALLYQHYKVATIDELERICKEQKLRELPRMGAKLEEKVLKSIAQYRQRAGRFLLSFGKKAAAELIPYLSETAGIDQIAAAGSLRRGKETIGDLDLLVTGPGAPEALERFVKHPKAHSVLGKGAEQSQHPIRPGRSCKWICARCRTKATAQPCNISPAAKNTTSSCAAAR